MLVGAAAVQERRAIWPDHRHVLGNVESGVRVEPGPPGGGVGVGQDAVAGGHRRIDGVDEAVVFDAVKSRGKTLQKCFDDAWSSDLTLEGPARVQWTIAGGKASALGILTGDDGHPGLVSCYGAVIRTMAFPEDATGTVVWSFLADRRAD